MKRILLYTAIIVGVTIGCTDLNDELSEAISNEKYPETADQIAIEHLAAYEALKELWDDNGYWFLTQEITSDELVAPRRGPHWYDGGKWLQLQYHSWNNESDAVWGMWREIYTGITKANEVVDKLSILEPNEETLSKLAEVKAIRAFYYYLLIDNFGDVIYETSFWYAEVNPVRSKRADIYDSLIVTLENGLDHMKTINDYATFQNYASREMAQALLAKLYLNGKVYSGNDSPEFYEKTIEHCDNLIANEGISLERKFETPFLVTTTTSPEVIFSIPFHETNLGGFRFHMRTLHYQHQSTYDMAIGPWNGFCVTPTHFDLYEDSDGRKDFYFQYGDQFDFSGAPLIVNDEQLYIDPAIPFANMELGGDYSEDFITNCGARVQKFEIYQAAQANLTTTFPIFRLADIYLMKAEAEIRLNGTPSQESVDNINAIRDRAGVAEWSAAEVTLESILDERGRELFAEGHRRSDLIRYGLFDQPLWCKGDGTDPNDPGAVANENVFPVPQSAISTNPNLELPPQ